MPRPQRRRCNNFRARFPPWPRHAWPRRADICSCLIRPPPDLHLSFAKVLLQSGVFLSNLMNHTADRTWHGTTILCLRKHGQVVVAGDGQVSMGQTVVKSNARKLRRLGGGAVIAGFAGGTADAFALFERLEGKLEQYAGQLPRACVELAKDWRTDRYLRRLEAMMAVADKNVSLLLSGTGDVLEPEDGIIGIGSGGGYALAAARALIGIDGLDAKEVACRAMAIAAGICIYTNDKVTVEKLDY